MHPNAISICRNPVATCHNDVTDEAVRRPEPSHLSHSFVTVLRQMAERGETAETPNKNTYFTLLCHHLSHCHRGVGPEPVFRRFRA